MHDHHLPFYGFPLTLFMPIAAISVHDSIFTFVKWGYGYKIKYYKIWVYAT